MTNAAKARSDAVVGGHLFVAGWCPSCGERLAGPDDSSPCPHQGGDSVKQGVVQPTAANAADIILRAHRELKHILDSQFAGVYDYLLPSQSNYEIQNTPRKIWISREVLSAPDGSSLGVGAVLNVAIADGAHAQAQGIVDALPSHVHGIEVHTRDWAEAPEEV
jgi:hypothetical protein